MNSDPNSKTTSLINLDFVNRLTELKVTNREKEILVYLAQGKTNKEISQCLTLSPSTVRNHIANIFAKLNISNRVQATAIAIYAGLLNDFSKDKTAVS